MISIIKRIGSNTLMLLETGVHRTMFSIRVEETHINCISLTGGNLSLFKTQKERYTFLKDGVIQLSQIIVLAALPGGTERK